MKCQGEWETQVREVTCIPLDAYVVCGTKMLSPDSTTAELGLVGGRTLQVQGRLRGCGFGGACVAKVVVVEKFLSLVSGCVVCAMPTGAGARAASVVSVGTVG